MGKGLRMHVSLKLNLGNIKKQNHKGTKSTLCGHNKLWQFRKCFLWEYHRHTRKTYVT